MAIADVTSILCESVYRQEGNDREHEPFIRKAIGLAIASGKKGNDTFGAVLVHEGQIIATAENTRNTGQGYGHAEYNLAIRSEKKVDRRPKGENVSIPEQEIWPLGKWIDCPAQTLRDETTGQSFRVLTGGAGNNRHIYFNRANFTGDGRYVVFLSDRTGRWQVYVYDLHRERLRRLTEAALDPGRPSIDPLRPLLYYTQGSAVHRLHLDTLDETVVYAHPTPPGGTFLLMDISGDGQYLGFMEIGPYEKARDNTADFVRRFEARPLSRFWIATSDGARVWKAHEQERHLQHLLFNPTDPTTLMFCYEGPWDRVEQRMWLMRWDGSQIRPLRYQEHPDLALGHEYWLAGGRHVDYVRRRKGEPTAVCRIDVLSGRETVLSEHPFSHFISDRSGQWIVGDDAQHVSLLEVATGEVTPLVRHGQELTIANTLYHPHPAFGPDGRRIVFCRRDSLGHNDVCLLER